MENNSQTQELKNSKTNPSYADVLREIQQEEFPLLSEVTRGFVDDPITLMNSIYDEDGVVVPCPLPDAMWKHLPQMMSETACRAPSPAHPLREGLHRAPPPRGIPQGDTTYKQQK